MLYSGKLPHPPLVLADLVSIAWVGTFCIPPPYLRGTFGVSRTRIYRALRWLRANNPEYVNIKIDDTMWDALPAVDGDIPTELLVRAQVDHRILLLSLNII